MIKAGLIAPGHLRIKGNKTKAGLFSRNLGLTSAIESDKPREVVNGLLEKRGLLLMACR